MRITMARAFPTSLDLRTRRRRGRRHHARRRPNRRNLVTLDIGGTSTDISVIADGRQRDQQRPHRRTGHRHADAGGAHARRRRARLAWIGRDGLMKVGPQSAGAVPGRLLRPRRNGPDGDRCQPRARRARHRQRARRPHDARPRPRRAGDMEGVARPLGLDPHHRRRRHPQDRQHQHGGRPAARVPEPRRGPAPLCVARFRRGRPAARRLSRARPRHPGRGRAAASGADQRDGPAADRRAASLSALGGRAPFLLSGRRDQRHLRRAAPPRPRGRRRGRA